MGNSCCCECYPQPTSRRPLPKNAADFHGHYDRDLLGGKGTGQRIYNKYQSKSRKAIPSYNVKSSRVETRGRDNLAFTGESARSPTGLSGTPGKTLAPVHVPRRKHANKHAAHNIRLARLNEGNGRNRNSNNRSNENVAAADTGNQTHILIVGEVKADVIGLSGKDSEDAANSSSKRSYSLATTVSLRGQTPDKFSSVSIW